MSAGDFRVQRQHVDDDLHFVVEAFREQRTQRTVDQARDQRFAFRRTAFATEEATRDLAGGVGLFEVIDGQREEVLTRLGRLARRPRSPARRYLRSSTITAPLAWRAISPVSRRTLCCPHLNSLTILLNIVIAFPLRNAARTRSGAATPGPAPHGKRSVMPFQRTTPTSSTRANRWNDTKLCPEARPCISFLLLALLPDCCFLHPPHESARHCGDSRCASHEAHRSKTKCLYQWN